MPKPAQIVTVCHLPTVQWMFDAIEPRLASAGYEVVPYRTEAAFRADATALATADVLLAAGQLPCSRALMASAPRLRAIICP
jgi:phosphoglycerate dehydrogenase-like enzyme